MGSINITNNISAMRTDLPYPPVQGKTYSLFGSSGHTREFYQAMNSLADGLTEYHQDTESLIRLIRENSPRRRRLHRLAMDPGKDFLSSLLQKLEVILRPYINRVEIHLTALKWRGLRDRRLGTTREQYYLHALEFILVNRINKNEFLACEKKIALLPYCLQDFSKACEASPDDVDYRCGHCSKKCYQNQVTRILEKQGIAPYIWMEGVLKSFFRRLNARPGSLGILGIACLPELVNGIHECANYHIPVVGIPLDANRCRRWWGQFFPNSVNLEEIEKLVSPV